MLKAHEIMSRSLATCSPETAVAEVAATMRDRNIGNVLVVTDDELHGIVTDRDLAVRALTGDEDLQQTPIRKYMSKNVVTGQPNWGLDKVAKVMARHQIRRLPIVQDSQVVGIVSLGDVALHTDKKHAVADSLKAISQQSGGYRLGHLSHVRIATGMGLAATAAAVVALVTLTNSGQTFRKKLAKSKLL